MTLGDLVLVNAFLIQLYIPLNFLGVLYREIKQSLTDIERMFRLLEQNREVAGRARRARRSPRGACAVRFEHVGLRLRRRSARSCSTCQLRRSPRAARSPWSGTRGSGKSHAGAAAVPLLRRQRRRASASTAGHPRAARRRACARAIGIVPQDTVLFNDTHLLQHPVRPARGDARGGDRGGAGGAHPRVHRAPARRLRDAGRRARPQALRRREAARRHRARPAQESRRS